MNSDESNELSPSSVTEHGGTEARSMKAVGVQNSLPKNQAIAPSRCTLKKLNKAEPQVKPGLNNQTEMIDNKTAGHNSNVSVAGNNRVQQLDHRKIVNQIIKISDVLSVMSQRSKEEGISHAILNLNGSVREKIKQIKERLFQKYLHRLQAKKSKWLEVINV